MTSRDLKLLLFYLARFYAVFAVAYCVYIWLAVQTHHASIRTAIALLAFAVCVLLPERFATHSLSETLIALFGLTGTTVLLLVTISQAT